MQHTCDDQCDVKRRLLEAAKRLFAKQGFDATSVRQICVEAGANVALVSYHFGGKEQLFRAIYEQYIREERFQEFVPLMEEPVLALKAFIRALVNYRFDEPEIVAITFREISSDSQRTDTLKDYLLPVWQLLRAILLKGKETGVFHIDSVDYSMTGLMGMLMFPPRTGMISTVLDKPMEREAMLRSITGLAFRAVGMTEQPEG
ncbi:TetR family transcriptional regulator [Gorillibacterium sp. sgz5001074]|uniref:TetR family transcriptional regulator n=1 Tax=Gorillibacterium sp. sgz5001074 TaxID=3446695 RepID=UPI003F6818AB